MRLGPLELSRQILGSTILGALGYETQEREKTKDTRERERKDRDSLSHVSLVVNKAENENNYVFRDKCCLLFF